MYLGDSGTIYKEKKPKQHRARDLNDAVPKCDLYSHLTRKYTLPGHFLQLFNISLFYYDSNITEYVVMQFHYITMYSQ